MAGFLYFVEGNDNELSPPEIDQLGLTYALAVDGDSPRYQKIVGDSSPSGKPGGLYATGQSLRTVTVDSTTGREAEIERQLRFSAAGQAWKHWKGPVWVGHETSAKPTEADLRRPITVYSQELTLGDRQQWQIPVAFVHTENETTTALPCTMTLENGEWKRGDPIAIYAGLVERLTAYFDMWHAACKEALLSDKEEFSIGYTKHESDAAHVLSVNYYLSEIEAAMLSLFVTAPHSTAQSVLSVACNLDVAIGWLLKKKAEQEYATSDSQGGAEGEIIASPLP